MKIKELKELLKNKIMIFDGAMGTEITRISKNKRERSDELPNDFLNIKDPEIIEQIHLSYIDAGADVIETNTFNSNSIVLSEYSQSHMVSVLNRKGVEIAKKAVMKSGKDIFIAASVGPLNISLSLGSKYSFDDVKNAYREQSKSLLDAGVDLLLFETAHDIINLKAGLIAISEIMGRYADLPVIASITVDKNGFMLSGHNIESAYVDIMHFDIIAIGMNCSTGPIEMESSLSRLSDISDKPLFVMPNAGLPDENGNYPMSADTFADAIKRYASLGYINIAGGCCGTSYVHIKKTTERLKGIKPREIKKTNRFAVAHKIAIFEDDIEKPFLAAERMNSLGSKKFRKLVNENKIDEIKELARMQVEKGAHILDISFLNPERDEIKDIEYFLPEILKNIKTPIMIDSTNISAHETAAKLSGAKLIINSVNFENGYNNPLKAVELNKKYGSLITVGLIDESGLSYTLDKKMSVAEKAFEFFVIKNGVDKNSLIFDPLVFPVATSDYRLSATDTISALKEIKEKYGIRTILGISNVSFGLDTELRKYVNSVFLHLAIKNNLDFAIVNIMELFPYALMDLSIRESIENLLNGNITELTNLSLNNKKRVDGTNDKEISSDDFIKRAIIYARSDGIDERIKDLLAKRTALDIINSIIMPALKDLGIMFSKGELIVTEVISSAGVTSKIMNMLKPYLSKENFNRGKFLIATVKGDVHDIGKNLVSMIFESNGFEVIDLGTRVETDVIIENVLKYNPDVIGLSGLLSRSCGYMVDVAKKLSEQNINKKLILGGAALSKAFVEKNIKTFYSEAYYAKDAMDGLNIAINNISDPDKSEDIINITEKTNYQKKDFTPDDIPQVNSFDKKIFKNFSTDMLFENLDYDMLFLRFFNLKKSQPDKITDMNKRIMDMKDEIKNDGYVEARGIYQIFKAGADESGINIYDEKEIFLKQIHLTSRHGISINDFVMKDNNLRKDIIAFTLCSTFINQEKIKKILDDKEKVYIIKSISIMLAEAMTDVLHYFIRRDMNIAEKELDRKKFRGIRYSPGYPAIDISVNKDIFELLGGNDIGTDITESFMFEPESSVASLVLHNPKAFHI
jgi:5-methyltetrahydrofolate--homocysteine methyltransferase